MTRGHAIALADIVRSAGELPAEDALSALVSRGVSPEDAATANAYAISRGWIGMDWAFRLHDSSTRT